MILVLEESDEEEFNLEIFDISKKVSQPTLIKKVAYGILSYLHDEQVLPMLIREGAKDSRLSKPKALKKKRPNSADIKSDRIVYLKDFIANRADRNL